MEVDLIAEIRLIKLQLSLSMEMVMLDLEEELPMAM
jgi:hypothetical protein